MIVPPNSDERYPDDLRELIPWMVQVQHLAPVAMRTDSKIPLEKWRCLGLRDVEELRKAWARFRRYAVGVLCEPSYIVAIDIDGEEGMKNWRRISKGHHLSTLRLRTPNGVHYLFRVSNGARYKTCASLVAAGIDVRHIGGLIKVWDRTQPERRFDGRRDIAELPEWLARVLPLAGTPASANGGRAGRNPLGAVGAAVVAGEYGSQRQGLLMYMLEAQRTYPLPVAKLLTYELAQMLPVMKPGRPWEWEHIRGLVKPGVIPDATDEEIAELSGISVRRGAR